MHFILGALGIIGAVLYYLTVIRNASGAAKEGVDAVTGAYGKARWRAWKRKNIKLPHQLIDDPGVSACALLLTLFREEGELSDHHWSFLRQDFRLLLKQSADEFEQTLAQARFAVGKMTNSMKFATDQGKFLRIRLDDSEASAFLAVLERAYALNSTPTHAQTGFTQTLVKQLRDTAN